jgi:hypothetical protein
MVFCSLISACLLHSKHWLWSKHKLEFRCKSHGAGATPVRQELDLIRWVEEGQAPDKLIAEKRDASGKVIRTRPLLPYPRFAKYKGSGSPDAAENFISTSPDK